MSNGLIKYQTKERIINNINISHVARGSLEFLRKNLLANRGIFFDFDSIIIQMDYCVKGNTCDPPGAFSI